MAEKRIGLRAYSRMRDCSPTAVQRAIADGRLKNSVTYNAKGWPEIDPVTANLEWKLNTDETKNHTGKDKVQPAEPVQPFIRNPEKPVTPGEGSEKQTLASNRAHREHYLALTAQLEYEKASGKLVDADAAKAAWVKLITESKTKLLALPSKAKSTLPHLTKADVAVLDRLMREALEGLASDGFAQSDHS